MDRKGKPRLQSDVQPAQLRIDQIKVLVQAFAGVRAQFQLLRFPIRANRERVARFDRRQDADQALDDLISPGDFPREVLFSQAARIQVTHRSPRLLGQFVRRPLHLIGQTHRIVLEILQQHVGVTKPDAHALQIRQPAERAAKANAIKTAERSLDFRLVARDKCIHGVTPVVGGDGRVKTTHHSTLRRHAFSIWLRQKAALGTSVPPW